MKYIVEIKPEYEDSFKGVMILGAKDSNLFVDALAVEDLEELNSDYINEHFGGLQEESYQKGYEDGKKNNDKAYQRGLEDAWEAARKIGHNSETGLKEVGFEFAQNSTYYNPSWYVVMHYAVSEVIEKLKAYEEQKADDEIKVGDEVEDHTDSFHEKAAVWSIKGDVLRVIAVGGETWMLRKNNAVRTGRHFDIEKILEAMRQ